jgi:hypothetical protein
MISSSTHHLQQAYLAATAAALGAPHLFYAATGNNPSNTGLTNEQLSPESYALLRNYLLRSQSPPDKREQHQKPP